MTKKTYRVLELSGLYSVGALIAGCGAFFLLLIGLVSSAWLFGFAVGLLVWLAGWHHVGSQVHEIRVADDGTVEFARLRGTVWMAARSVRVVEGVRSRDEDGDVYWRLRIKHARGRVDVWYFEEAKGFVGDVRAHNPAVEIAGRWPAGPP
jgi:hypothetical protein